MVDVHADYAAACGFEDLHGELSEQAQTDHAYNIAQFDVGGSHSMQGDCTNCGCGCLIETDFSAAFGVGRDSREQQTWDGRKFGVYGVTGAGASYTIAGTNIRHTFADGDYSSGAAVTGSARLIHTAADCGYGRQQSIAADFIPNLAHQVGTHFGLLQKILSGEFG
jgi:hypothetical protein